MWISLSHWRWSWLILATAPISKSLLSHEDRALANYRSAFFNDVTYTTPIVPTLYTVLTSGDAASNVSIYGDYTNSFVLEKDDVVEIILNNNDPGKHPFHLHGHDFQVVYRSGRGAGFYDPNHHGAFHTKPMRRDVLMVRPNGNFVIRFRANNPGKDPIQRPA